MGGIRVRLEPIETGVEEAFWDNAVLVIPEGQASQRLVDRLNHLLNDGGLEGGAFAHLPMPRNAESERQEEHHALRPQN